MLGNSPMRGAFTLIEVIAGVFLLAMMLATIAVAFHRTTSAVIDKAFRERAGAVAQRQLELLIASGQEPNSLSLRGRDEFDPIFQWELTLSREVVGRNAAREDLSNTVIKATVTVTDDVQGLAAADKIQMTRYFASLLPLPGHDIAVPLIPEQQEAPWYIELRDRLGREPTIDESFQEMARIFELPPDLMAAPEDEDEDEEADADPNEPDRVELPELE